MYNITNQNKHYWIDNLRAVSCIAVIFLHVSGPWLYKFSNYESMDWLFVNLLHSFTRFCVPVFLMISGFLLINNSNTDYKVFYKVHLMKILKPFVFWTFFYILIYISYDIYQNGDFLFIDIAKKILNSLVFGAAYHLWYMYIIILFYLLIPFISIIKINFGNQIFIIFLIIWFIVLILSEVFPSNNLFYYTRFSIGYFGYLLIGSFINSIKFKSINFVPFSLIFIVVGYFAIFYPVYNSAIRLHFVDYSKYYYLNASVVLLSVGLFLLAMSFNKNYKILNVISKNSFGIYFIHLFYIMLFNKILSNIGFLPIYVYIFLFSLLCLVFSLYSIVILKKVSFLSKFI